MGGDGAEQGGHAWDNEVLLDNIVLYELSKDLLRASTMDELFDVILFSVMGQIGVSSSSIMIPSSENPDEWEIVESRGVTINPDEVDFRPTAGILKQMITRKEIIDVEEFKDNAAFSDDYYSYISIDARLLVPVIYNQEVLAAIILGNKLTSENYTGEEKGFFNVIAEYSAFSFRAIRFKEALEFALAGIERQVSNINLDTHYSSSFRKSTPRVSRECVYGYEQGLFVNGDKPDAITV